MRPSAYTLILAMCLAANAQAANTFNVRDFGAVRDASIMSTAAIQKAVDACEEAGGGTESHSAFENITVSNCVITDSNRGINMTIRDGGDVSNILFTNIVIDTRRMATFWWGNGDPVWLTTQRRGDIDWCGSIENVTFSHIIAHGQSGVRVENFDSRIANIRFYDFQLFMEHEDAVDKRSRHGFFFQNVDGLRLFDCSVVWERTNPEPTWGEDFVFDNVKNLCR